jgi:BirA family biotin operon repressor/biotin-[acetyl-CoA-carboxylase] ligase
LVSVLLRPNLAVEELHLCTVAVALAAAGACEQGAGVVPDLKWPNDLMVGDRKLGGILAEALPAGTGMTGAGGSTPAVVVGLGLNVRWPPPDTASEPHPGTAPGSGDEQSLSAEQAEVLRAATSLWRQAATVLEPLALLPLILEQLEARLVDLADPDGRRRLASEYRRRCNTVGSTVRVTLPGEEFTGTATDITAEGHLIVDVGATSRTVAAGDVVHLRDPG